MATELVELYNDLDLQRLRVSRPSKFLFLCGGVVRSGVNAKPENLRDYIYRVRRMRSPYEVVLAEEATQLYRDTSYGDLISFEEDIARIAAVVLVIAESAGSLAELGAFASNDTIRKALRVMIQEKHETDESFIRYGPVERVKKTKREYLGVYPWRAHANGRLIISSVKPHYREIMKFINDHLLSVDHSTAFHRLTDASLFYIIYWVVYLCLAVTPALLTQYVMALVPDAISSDISNKLYCMELAGWLGRIPYSGQDYFYTCYGDDPFDYSFKSDVRDRDSLRRKLAVSSALLRTRKLPLHVRKVASERRSSPK